MQPQILLITNQWRSIQGTLFVVQSGGRRLGNLFMAVANHVILSQRQGGDMIRHSREQVSKSPAT